MSENSRLEMLGNKSNVRAILTWLLLILVILVHGTIETTGENAKNELIKTTEKEIGLEVTVDKIS